MEEIRMEYTPFGKELKKLMINKDIRMYDFAKELGVSSAFVSSVLTGKKNVPYEWFSFIRDYFQLSLEELINLENLAQESKDQCKIDLTNCNDLARKTVLEFQRNLNELDDETLKQINKIIKKGGGK